MQQNPSDRFREQWEDIAFSIAMTSIACLRYITDCIDNVPLGVFTRILNKHDFICQMVYLMKKSPWRFKDRINREFSFESGVWKSVAEEDKELLIKAEAQVCFA
jgi:hypothetical protein